MQPRHLGGLWRVPVLVAPVNLHELGPIHVGPNASSTLHSCRLSACDIACSAPSPSSAAHASATVVLIAQTARGPGAANHVVIISLDGFMASALFDESGAAADAAAPGGAGRGRQGHAPGESDGHLGEPYVDGHRRDAGEARRDLQRPAGPRDPACRRAWSRGATRSEMVHAPTLYDVAHERGLTTAQVDWVAIWNAPTVTWEFRERPDPQVRSRAR